jgi:hypothetical protein
MNHHTLDSMMAAMGFKRVGNTGITTIIKNGRVFKYRRRRQIRIIKVRGEKG